MTGASLYVDRDSFFHRLHPAAKIVGAAMLFAVFLAFNDPRYLACVTGAILVLLLIAARSLPLVRMGRFLSLLFVVSALLWALFLDDPRAREILPAWRWGPFHATLGSVLFGVAMALRILGMVLVGLLVITTTRPEAFSHGLRCLGMPPIFATATTLSFHLLPLFVTTALIVRQAQEARGLELRRLPLWTRFMRSGAVAVPVIGYALRRADDLTRSLELCGIGTRPPTYLYERPVTAGEIVLLVLLGALTVCCIYVRVIGYGEILPRL
jgi:energy-coupling factor transport system permease protein